MRRIEYGIGVEYKVVVFIVRNHVVKARGDIVEEIRFKRRFSRRSVINPQLNQLVKGLGVGVD